MSWIRVLLLNFFVLSGLLIAIEASLRLYWTARACYTNECDFSRLLNLEIYDDAFTEKNFGLSKYHETVGYIPNPGFKSRINASGWDNILVTIDSEGFRATGVDNMEISDKRVILTIGDSFTFGDQVNDTETWPSCVERRTNRKTLNAGVFGYGVAQAVRRASLILKEKEVDTVILGILIPYDFNRERLVFKDGFPRPAVIQGENDLLYAEVPPIDSPGTKWKPDELIRTLSVVKNSSMLLAHVLSSLGIDTTGMNRTEVHENAANIDKIVAFSIKEFSSLNVQNKFIVIQYLSKDLPNLNTEAERIKQMLLSEAQSAGIPVIDTYERLLVEIPVSEKNIWYVLRGHHTAHGNDIVCDEIFQVIQTHN